MITLVSRSAEETAAIAGLLARALSPPALVVLAGDLGAGKTCFVQGAARARGVTSPVTSPTFVIAREYKGEGVRIVHADAYRLDDLAEVEDLGGEELLADDAISFVEWGDAVSAALPATTVTVQIEVVGLDDRQITISSTDARVQESLESAFAQVQP